MVAINYHENLDFSSVDNFKNAVKPDQIHKLLFIDGILLLHVLSCFDRFYKASQIKNWI